MTIHLSKLRWKNFLSTGNDFIEIDLARNKTTLIVGENGAGKSQMLDALSYVLYNKSFRRINKPQLINTITQKNCLVEIEFETLGRQYLVRRGMRPGIFEIFQDGQMLNQDAASRDYQEVLEKQILKQNHKSFSQIVVLGSASYTPFMKLSGPQRREIIEDLLDLQIFSLMNVLLKEKVNANRTAIFETENELRMNETRKKLHDKNVSRSISNHENFIESRKAKIAEYRTEIDQKAHKIAEIDAKIDQKLSEIRDETSVLKQLNQLEGLENKINGKAAKLLKQVDFYKENDNCPTCTQTIDPNFKDNIIDKNNHAIEEIKLGLGTISTKSAKLSERIREIVRVHSDITELRKQSNELNVQVNSNIRFINQLELECEELLERLNKETKIDQGAAQQLVEERESLMKRKMELLEDRETINASHALLKDGGIKTQIVRQYVPVINNLINRYLSALQFMVSFELDDEFNEKIKSRFRDEFSYDSFSEGEKIRIDLAILSTWRAVAKMRNSATCNLLIMDEIFDSSLDSDGIDEVMSLMMEAMTDSNIFIISHKEQLLDKFDHVIKFEKVKNFTRML